MKNVLMVVSGPSGVGKGTLVKRLCKERTDVIESVSCTTREPREGEVDGHIYAKPIQYQFISFFLLHRSLCELKCGVTLQWK